MSLKSIKAVFSDPLLLVGEQPGRLRCTCASLRPPGSPSAFDSVCPVFGLQGTRAFVPAASEGSVSDLVIHS